MLWIQEWDAFSQPKPDLKCETCGFKLVQKTHYFTSEQVGAGGSPTWDGLSCDAHPSGLAYPLGNRRRSIFKGFNDTATPSQEQPKADCKCSIRDLMSPCGHAKDCGWMLNRKKAA